MSAVASGSLIELRIIEQKWQQNVQEILALLERCLAAVWQNLPDQPKGMVSILLADDATLQSLNKQYRGQGQPTNVLSFPAAGFPGAPAGDIALSYETCSRESVGRGITLEQHLCHLFVHGVLHLYGYDHQEQATAKAMEQLETKILLAAGYDDPWAQGDTA